MTAKAVLAEMLLPWSLPPLPRCSLLLQFSLGNSFVTLKVTSEWVQPEGSGSVRAGREKETAAVKPSAQLRRGRQPQAPRLHSQIREDGDANPGLQQRSWAVLGREGTPTPGQRSGLGGARPGGQDGRAASPPPLLPAVTPAHYRPTRASSCPRRPLPASDGARTGLVKTETLRRAAGSPRLPPPSLPFPHLSG